jgi:hypothetical protein
MPEIVFFSIAGMRRVQTRKYGLGGTVDPLETIGAE